MTTHCSILARRIPWTEEPGGLKSIGLHTVKKQLKRISRHTCSLLHQHPLIFSNLKRMSQAGINKDAFFEHNSCFLGKIHDLYLGLFHRTPPSFHIW